MHRNMRDFMQKRFKKFLVAMLDGHGERNADRVAGFIVIPASCAVAKNDFRARQQILKVLSINLLERSIGLSQKAAQAKKPKEIVIEIESRRGDTEPGKCAAIRLQKVQLRTLPVPTWGFLFDLFSRSVQSFRSVIA